MSHIKKGLGALLCAGALVICAGGAHAQYIGPGKENIPSTVASVLKSPTNGQHVVLRGYITKKISHDGYEFVDSTGKIRVSIDDKHFEPHKVSDKTRVELYGEVEKDFLKPPQVEVKRLTILAR